MMLQWKCKFCGCNEAANELPGTIGDGKLKTSVDGGSEKFTNDRTVGKAFI